MSKPSSHPHPDLVSHRSVGHQPSGQRRLAQRQSGHQSARHRPGFRDLAGGPVRVAFFGSYAWSVDYLAALHASPRTDVVLVVTRHDDFGSGGERTFATPVTEWCEAQASGIAVFKPRSLKGDDALAVIGAARPDVVVSAGYSLLLPEDLYGGVAQAGINVHPSLLPQYRGADPVRRAILDGVAETGVSLHLLTQAFDEGPLLWQHRIGIDPAWNAGDVLREAGRIAAPALPDVVHGFVSGRLEPFDQQGEATLAPALEGAEVEVGRTHPVETARRLYRALAPYRFPLWVDGGRRAAIVEMDSVADARCETLTFADGEVRCRLEDVR